MGMTDPDASELESLVVDAQKVEPLGDRAPRLNVLVFLSSLALNYSLYCLLALVSHITQFYSARTYEVVVGLLYVSALPMAALQLGFDRAYDLKYRSATAFAFRLGALEVRETRAPQPRRVGARRREFHQLRPRRQRGHGRRRHLPGLPPRRVERDEHVSGAA